jgi:hypothetical protein
MIKKLCFGGKGFRHFFYLQYMEILETNLPPKNADFYCEKCDFTCCKKSNWETHINTKKHINRISGKYMSPMEITKLPLYNCKCGKIYKSISGLWKHKKNCNLEKPIITTNPPIDMSYNVILEIVKQNQEFKELLIEQNKENQKLQQQLLEMAKEGKTINNNTTNNNTNNFNLQFFLNEQCKDALNIMDFINQLQLNTTDLDMVGRVGYSEGISKLFIRGLKELDVFKRPIHCSDLKREVVYVKDKDAWEKDNDEKNKMKTAIKYIAAKNFKQINEWREKNPDSDDYDSKKHMDYHQIVIHSMGGATKEEDDNNYNKIIRNVAKQVTIDKK